MSGQPLRPAVLALYRRVLRTARHWQSADKDPERTKTEKEFIRREGRDLFRKNKHIDNVREIQSRIQEAEARLALADHYKNPYPRPVNVPPMTYAKAEGKSRTKAQERQVKQSTPVYVKSLSEDP